MTILAVVLVCVKCTSNKRIEELETASQKETEVETTQEATEVETTTLEETEPEIITQETTESDTTTQQPDETEATTSQLTESETTQKEIEIQPIDGTLYGITLNKEKLKYDNEEKIYYVKETFTEISGTIKQVDEVQNCKIQITNEAGYTVLEREIEPAEKFMVNSFGLIIGTNNVTVTAEYQNG